MSELGLEKHLGLGDEARLLEVCHQGRLYVTASGLWRQQRDRERRQSQLAKAEAALRPLAAVRRQKTDSKKLAGQVGCGLQRRKAH